MTQIVMSAIPMTTAPPIAINIANRQTAPNTFTSNLKGTSIIHRSAIIQKKTLKQPIAMPPPLISIIWCIQRMPDIITSPMWSPLIPNQEPCECIEGIPIYVCSVISIASNAMVPSIPIAPNAETSSINGLLLKLVISTVQSASILLWISLTLKTKLNATHVWADVRNVSINLITALVVLALDISILTPTLVSCLSQTRVIVHVSKHVLYRATLRLKLGTMALSQRWRVIHAQNPVHSATFS